MRLKAVSECWERYRWQCGVIVEDVIFLKVEDIINYHNRSQPNLFTRIENLLRLTETLVVRTDWSTSFFSCSLHPINFWIWYWKYQLSKYFKILSHLLVLFSWFFDRKLYSGSYTIWILFGIYNRNVMKLWQHLPARLYTILYIPISLKHKVFFVSKWRLTIPPYV